MKARLARFTAFVVLAAVLAVWSTESASAQYRPRLFVVNPNPFIAPGVRLQQYAYNTAVIGQAQSQIPPYVLGYNPYPLSVNYGPVYSPYGYRPAWYSPAAPPYYGNVVPAGVPYAGQGYSPVIGSGGYMPMSSPYAYNSYPTGGYSAAGGAAGGAGGGAADPLTGLSGYNPVSGNPYYWNPYSGGYMYAPGDMLRGYGELGIDAEKARILREQANQAKLDTRKKTIDTMAYIRANEYTFTQEQADIAKRLMQRMQKNPTPTEIQTGKSLNILVDDLAKWETMPNADKARLPMVTLDEDVLKKVNLTSPGSSGNIGLLRDNGSFTWPTAFDSSEIVSEKERKDIELQARELYQQAANAKPDKNTIGDLESGLRNLRTKLSKAGNVRPLESLEAQRFLDSFDAAVTGLKNGDLVANLDFQNTFAKGGRTVKELIDYLAKKGMRFAPANANESAAYNALQTALVARSMAIHSEVSGGKDY
jgi:hypothetical protein